MVAIHRLKRNKHSVILLQKELRELAKGQLAKLRKEIESRSLTELNTTLEATTTSPDKHDQKFSQGDGEQVRERVGVEWKRMENAKMIDVVIDREDKGDQTYV